MQQVMSLSASSTYDIVLSGISGIASYNYDLLDPSGSSLIGFTRKGLNEQLYEYATCFDNKFRKLINFNVIPFSSDPVQDFVAGYPSQHLLGYPVPTTQLIYGLTYKIPSISKTVKERA